MHFREEWCSAGTHHVDVPKAMRMDEIQTEKRGEEWAEL
jgi:hypothetical protein